MILKHPVAREIYRKEGLKELIKRVAGQCRNYAVDRITTPYRGRYLYDHDWDLAVILDACRYDLGYEISRRDVIGLGEPQRAYSVGSTSKDWIERTFNNAGEGQIGNTIYICANPFVSRVPENRIKYLDKVYQYGWEHGIGTVPPRVVTDRTIRLMRADTADRYIAHYMQPHLPSINPSKESGYRWEPTENGQGDIRDSKTAWARDSSGIDHETIIQNYERNLKPVLDDVQLLLDNVDATDVVITADHGTYLGEHGRWGHPGGHTHPAVRHVPWWETDATDSHTHEPAMYERTVVAEREAQLRRTDRSSYVARVSEGFAADRLDGGCTETEWLLSTGAGDNSRDYREPSCDS